MIPLCRKGVLDSRFDTRYCHALPILDGIRKLVEDLDSTYLRVLRDPVRFGGNSASDVCTMIPVIDEALVGPECLRIYDTTSEFRVGATYTCVDDVNNGTSPSLRVVRVVPVRTINAAPVIQARKTL